MSAKGVSEISRAAPDAGAALLCAETESMLSGLDMEATGGCSRRLATNSSHVMNGEPP